MITSQQIAHLSGRRLVDLSVHELALLAGYYEGRRVGLVDGSQAAQRLDATLHELQRYRRTAA